MMNTLITTGNSFRLTLRWFVPLFLPLAIISSAVALYIFQSEVDAELDNYHASESAKTLLTKGLLGHRLDSIARDLIFLVGQDSLIEHASDISSATHYHLEKDWLIFSRAKKVYDQIRLLDSSGQERIRINYNRGKPFAIAADQLQDKAGRYYFSGSINLNKGELFISPLDLNVEHGQIEQPLKPVIRIASPVFDKTDKKQGIVILNYYGDEILRELNHSDGSMHPQTWLINREGYWLKGPSRELEWGFMHQDTDSSMVGHHPEAWSRILAADKGQFEDDNGLWTFTTVYPLLEGQKTSSDTRELFIPSRSKQESHNYFWKVVRHIPIEKYYAPVSRIGIKLTITTTIFLIGLSIGCWWLARAWVRENQIEEEIRQINTGLENTIKERTIDLKEAKKQAEQLARTDELTGMNNRRAFFEYGEIIEEQTKRHGRLYTIAMLDLDHFKRVNDSYGHEAGDQALKALTKIINKAIRSSDIAGRVGGEEFAIIMPETSATDALNLAERLRKSISETRIPAGQDKLSLTISIGIAVSDNKNTSITDVMIQADKALYQAKKAGRNQVVLFQTEDTPLANK